MTDENGPDKRTIIQFLSLVNLLVMIGMFAVTDYKKAEFTHVCLGPLIASCPQIHVSGSLLNWDGVGNWPIYNSTMPIVLRNESVNMSIPNNLTLNIK
jgi:hypothetical protein